MYNKISSSQLSIHTVQMKYKNKQLTCKFFVVPVNGTALFGMPGIELLKILSIMLNTNDVPQKCREINAQMAQG